MSAEELSYIFVVYIKSLLKTIMDKPRRFFDSHWSSDITVLNINILEIKQRI